MSERFRWGRPIAWLISDQSGVTAIEYAMIAALLAVLLIVAMFTVGRDLADMFVFISAAITNLLSG
jgi:pilus assembly protein Flp/PilA